MAFHRDSKAVLLQTRFLIRMVRRVWIRLLNSIARVGLKAIVHEDFQAGDSWPRPKGGILAAEEGKFSLCSSGFFMQVCYDHFSQLRK